MVRLWSRYLWLLDVHPVPTKMATSAALYTAGDGIAQRVDGTATRSGYNADRGIKAAVWGGLIFAPLAHVWYNRILERSIPGTTLRPVLTKVFLDQTAWAAAMNALYLSYAAVYINRGKLADAETAVRAKMWPLMRANWLLWPAVQIVNFRFVPAPLQVPFINVVVLGWSAYLALLATAPNEETDGKESKAALVSK